MTGNADRPQRRQGWLQRLSALALFVPVICLSSTAQSREPLYGVLDHEPLLACEELYWSGQRERAAACYRGLQSPAMPAAIRAEAMWALDDLQAANRLFQSAYNDNPDSALIRIRWAELFTRTYQYQDAWELFQEALQLEPDNAWAHVGVARALQESGTREGVNEHLDAVMQHFAAPAGARFRVMLMAIHGAMEQDDYERAREGLAEAWQLARAEALPQLNLHALEAALAFVQRGDPQAHIDAALAANPAYGDAWAIPGYFASITRRYREAGQFFQQAVNTEPTHWQAHLLLGQNHMRLNRIPQGKRHIETAYSGDAFNPVTLNLMRLLDSFEDNFTDLVFPDPPEGDGLPELILRLHVDEKDVLRDYVLQLAEERIDEVSDR